MEILSASENGVKRTGQTGLFSNALPGGDQLLRQGKFRYGPNQSGTALHAVRSSAPTKVRFYFQRQSQREQTAFINLTSDLNNTPMRIDNGFSDRKPKPSATMSTRAGLV